MDVEEEEAVARIVRRELVEAFGLQPGVKVLTDAGSTWLHIEVLTDAGLTQRLEDILGLMRAEDEVSPTRQLRGL